MPFRFDRTPLGAVESLARRAGQVQAENTAFSQNLALRQLANQEQNQAYARESESQDRAQRDNAFKLQLASAARDEERIKIAERKASVAEQFGGERLGLAQDRAALAERKQSEAERATGVKETNAGRGLDIRESNAGVYAQRSAYTDEVKKLGDIINNSMLVLKDTGKDFQFIGGKWTNFSGWNADVKDDTKIRELNAAKQSIEMASSRLNEVQKRMATTAGLQSTAVSDPATSQLMGIFNSYSKENQEKITLLRSRGFSDSAILAKILTPDTQ